MYFYQRNARISIDPNLLKIGLLEAQEKNCFESVYNLNLTCDSFMTLNSNVVHFVYYMSAPVAVILFVNHIHKLGLLFQFDSI